MGKTTPLILILISVLFASNSIQAQEYYDSHLRLEEWNKGEITLLDGTKIVGDISFNYFLSLVQFLDEEKVNTYGITQVSSFKIFKSDEGQELNYRLLNLPTGTDFYRVLAEDQKKAFVVQTYVLSEKNYYSYPSVNLRFSKPDETRTSSVQSHFERREVYILLRRNGEVEPFAEIALNKKLKGRVIYNSKKTLLELLSEFDPNVDEFVERNDLNIKKRNDLIQIIMKTN